MLTGMVQAYIFAILATVYITAATTENKRNTTIKNITTKKEIQHG